MTSKIEIVRSDEKYMTYTVELDDPAGWLLEQPYRRKLVADLMLLIAEFEEEEVSLALGAAIVGQEARRQGLIKFGPTS